MALRSIATKKNLFMGLKIIVLAKQVPDTRCVGGKAMNDDGTINRSALPAIFNPEDLLALEQAILLKENNPGSKVTVVEVIDKSLVRVK